MMYTLLWFVEQFAVHKQRDDHSRACVVVLQFFESIEIVFCLASLLPVGHGLLILLIVCSDHYCE
eukprot:3183-Heterococcus_DN1.PRE.5